jgi:DNA-directed RNA polymerase subunit RPC12/RpoP
MPEPLADQEAEYRCTNCHRLLYHDELQHYACRPCEARGRNQITELAGLYRSLSTALAPGNNANTSGRVRTSRAAPLPVSLHILDMVGPGGIVAELQAIEDNWRSARGRVQGPRNDGVNWFASWRTKSPGHAIADHTTYITYNMRWACESYEEVAYDLGVIRKLHARAETAVAGPSRRCIVVACLAEYDDGTKCGAELPIDISAAATTCRTCGARWMRDDWVRLHEATLAASAA